MIQPSCPLPLATLTSLQVWLTIMPVVKWQRDVANNVTRRGFWRKKWKCMKKGMALVFLTLVTSCVLAVSVTSAEWLFAELCQSLACFNVWVGYVPCVRMGQVRNPIIHGLSSLLAESCPRSQPSGLRPSGWELRHDSAIKSSRPCMIIIHLTLVLFLDSIHQSPSAAW